jgi:hypothetical protein
MQLYLTDNTAPALRQMTAGQLLYLGTRQVAYLKVGSLDGEPAFLIYGADGAPLEVVDAIETAMEVVAESGLRFVTVH